MATMQRRDVLAARAEQDVALASDGKQTTLLDYTQIRANGGTQMRAAVNEETAAEYADALRGGATFPPVVVFFDGSNYWLGDGFHRYRAYFMTRGHSARIPAEVRSGTRRDAVLCAAGANASHGLRRTADDKRRAVETLLRDDEWGQWSDREIARRCSVSPTFVGKTRGEIAGVHTVHVDSMETERTFVHPRTGEPTTMRTEKIGTNRPPSVSVPLTRVLGKCRLCGAGLTDPESVARGYGPECADRMARAAQQDAYQGSDGQAMIEASEAYAAAALAAMAAGQTPPDVAAAMVEPSTELPGAGALDDDGEAPPVLPVDLVALGCRLELDAGFYHVRFGSHRSEYASFDGAVAWCRRITGTDGTTQQGTRQERIAGLLALYQQVLELLPDYGALTGDFTGALPLRRVLEPMVTRLEANATKGAA